MKKPFISLTSDFGVQSQGVGIMEATALGISPNAHIIHLMHGLPDFDIASAARTLETVKYLPVGYHVCVVDPGVGTKRKPIIIKTKRGDYLVGPDNGVLIPAARMLGGAAKIVEISNPKYMRHPISPIFHGRDIFVPAAAYLSRRIPLNAFGRTLRFGTLKKPPYDEAVFTGKNCICAKVIHINKYGSLHLNITNEMWDKFRVKVGQSVFFKSKNRKIKIPVVKTFGDVKIGAPVILKDDYGRVEVAINSGNFAKRYKIKIGAEVKIRYS